MKMATAIAHNLARLAGLVQLLTGLLFWTGNALALLPLHLLVGLLLVLALWVLAALAARAGVAARRVALAALWGLLVPIFGMTQTQLLPGPWHWVIQVLHLLVGIGAVGMAEGLAQGITERRPSGAESPPSVLAREA
jgi:hypothetical protein